MGRRRKRISKLTQPAVSMSQGKAGGDKASHSPEKKSTHLAVACGVRVRSAQPGHARLGFSHLNARPGRSRGHIA
jgi:hypothetical protein